MRTFLSNEAHTCKVEHAVDVVDEREQRPVTSLFREGGEQRRVRTALEEFSAVDNHDASSSRRWISMSAKKCKRGHTDLPV